MPSPMDLSDLEFQQYTSVVRMALQTKGGKLRPLISPGSYSGNGASVVDELGSTEAYEVTSSGQALVYGSLATDRRWVYPKGFTTDAIFVDSFAKRRSLTDPTGHIPMALVAAIGRKFDNEIITAFFADAKTGENGGTTTSFPAGQIVAVTEGAAGNTGLTIEKLRAARKLFEDNNVDLEMEGPLYCAVTSDEKNDLFAEFRLQNVDYGLGAVLSTGVLPPILGFTFVETQLLASSGGNRLVPVWVNSGMHWGSWDEPAIHMAAMTTTVGHPMATHMTFQGGATRVHEKKVVQILCA